MNISTCVTINLPHESIFKSKRRFFFREVSLLISKYWNVKINILRTIPSASTHFSILSVRTQHSNKNRAKFIGTTFMHISISNKYRTRCSKWMPFLRYGSQTKAAAKKKWLAIFNTGKKHTHTHKILLFFFYWIAKIARRHIKSLNSCKSPANETHLF